MLNTIHIKRFAFLLLVLPIGARIQAQTSSSTSTDNITELEKFTVSGIPVDSDILPTIRPIGSVLGDDRSMLHTDATAQSIAAKLGFGSSDRFNAFFVSNTGLSPQRFRLQQVQGLGVPVEG